MKMKKIWAILLAAIMLVSSFPALSEGPDKSEGVPTNVQLISGVDIQEEIKEGAEETAEGYLYTLADDSGTILQSLDFKSITVKTGSIHVTVAGTTSVTMKEGASLAYDGNDLTLSGNLECLELKASVNLILDGVNITALAKYPGIRIYPEAKDAVIILAEDSINNVKGSENYAGIEVGWASQDNYAGLTIDGNGTLKATGGSNAAGIGGSKDEEGPSKKGKYGNITIDSGSIQATGDGGGAGIGSSNNTNGGKSNGSYKNTDQRWGVITINGGTINATGANSAGIGGGNHQDSGLIIINGGTITAQGASGIGTGTGSSKNDGTEGDKGPGYYFATIVIHGGNITARALGDDNWGGAGIGGGAYCDAEVTIDGSPTIKAYGGSAGADHNALHHGGAGIGGGYEGHANISISGGYIEAHTGKWSNAAAIGSGGAPNSNPDRGNTGRGTAVYLDQTTVTISGGTVNAVTDNQARGAAGIGGGTGADRVSVNISGGRITAVGAKSNDDNMLGGAGIGGGANAARKSETGMTGTESAKYQVDTSVIVSISGGTVVATGGWGAAGIGSGANNKMANTINIKGGDVQAYADGTKFAIDTRILNDDETTISQTEGRNISVPVLQGTFVHNYTLDGGMEQNPEGLKSIVLENDSTGTAAKELTRMPAGYRSFAATVPSVGVYNVYTDSESIGQGGGRYFAEALKDVYDKDELADVIQYSVNGNSLSDNFYLYPVKTFVVEKKMASETEGDSLSDINTTAHFNLVIDDTQEVYDTARITITNGTPQGRAYFVNVPDNNYEIWEVDGNGKSPVGQKFGTHILSKITTSDSSEGESNDGSITPEKWTDTVVVTNTYGSSIMDIDVKKVWSDNDNQDGIRPDSVTLQLLANGTEMAGRTATLSAANNWTATFAGLERQDDEGKEIVYAIRENTVAGYTAAITGTAADGFTVTNTHVPAATEVSVGKVWNDSNNQDGKRPESVTVRLMADGKETQTAALSAANNWRYTFTGLPVNNAGKAIAYTITEDAVAGYTTEITGTATAGFIVTNTHVPATTEVTVTKVWSDNNDQDGIRPANVTIRLLADGTEVRNAMLSGGESGWRHTFTELPLNNAGQAIAYTITEDTVPGYAAAITGTAATGYTVTNTHEPAVTQVAVAKVWNDNSNQDGIRPAAVTVNVMANGRQVRTQRVTGNGNRWTYTFTGLPQFENGTAITYTVNENAVNGYTVAITGTAAAGFTLTNTHTPEVISVSGRKTWADQNDTDGIRPASITVHLTADGRTIETRTITDGTYTFENLPRFSNGREIAYAITEDPVEGYTTEINGYNLTNRHTPLRVSVNGAKVWGDHENKDGLRPEAITVHLLADGQEIGSQRVTGTGDKWAYSFTNLPGYADGKLIQYTVTEDAVEGYETTIVGNEIYNIHRDEEAQEDQELYTLTVRYWADGQTAFPDFKGTYEFGAPYNVVSPDKPGYTVDLAEADGIIVEDTVIDVYYTPKPVTLTIYYQYMDGSIAADTYFETLMPGVPYDVESPVIEGYTATQLRVEGTMPNRNAEFVVWYLPEAEPDPDTGRTRIPGGYTMINEYGVPLGLGEVNRNAGECVE